jgi:hypothetical protein
MVKPLPSKQVSSVRFRLAAPCFAEKCEVKHALRSLDKGGRFTGEASGYAWQAPVSRTPARSPEKIVFLRADKAVTRRFVYDSPYIGIAAPWAWHRSVKHLPGPDGGMSGSGP